MKAEELNLFIVDDDKSMVLALKEYLTSKFGGKVKISTFFDGESCLKNINDETDVVILDYFLNNHNGNEILKSIKERNPRTEVIMLSGNENLETAIESFRLGAKNYIVKSNKALRKIYKLIKSLVGSPMNEFGMTKFVSILLLTLLSMGAAIGLFIKLIS